MTEQQPDPLLQALKSHGTAFFLFLLAGADLLATALSFVYSAFVGSWILAALSWLLGTLDYLTHRDLLATIVIIILLTTLIYGGLRRVWTGEWRSSRASLLTVSIPVLALWLLLEILGVTLGSSTRLVQWIPPLPHGAFPDPIPLRLWPFWQLTGLYGAGWYLIFTHRKAQSPRPDVNVRTKHIPIPMEPELEPVPMEPELEEELGYDPFGVHSKRASVVDADAMPRGLTQPAQPAQPQYHSEIRVFPLSIIHAYSKQWNILETHYARYRAALQRFHISPIPRLRIPPQSTSYKGKGDIGWQKHVLALPDELFLPKNAELMAGYLAHELAYYQTIDLWVRDLLSHYPNEITGKAWFSTLLGQFQLLPTLTKVWYMPGWEHDRTKDGDIFAYLVGEGPRLKRQLEFLDAADRDLMSSASLNPESPPPTERIGQLEGLINHEHDQMRAYGLEPPQEQPLLPEEKHTLRLRSGKRSKRSQQF